MAQHKETMIAGSRGSAHAGGTTEDDFQSQRERRAGTQLGGMDGLHEPGSEGPRIRLVAGRVVPGTRYRILRWLGEGGMGVVYEAEHIDIDRKVALKILRFDLSQQPNIAQVFRDEARAASRIGADEIVEIFDFGELEDGRLFFCMEMLDGRDLVPATEEDWVEPGRLIGILRQMCKGLGAAHRAEIVHRDIKPENVIVVDDGGRERVKVVDFGISAMLAAGHSDGGTIAGTPHYMAPEQITAEPFDGRLDMYALGCMAYELLVGHPPFLADEIQELLRQQLNDEPPPIKSVRPDRDIPDELCTVVERCLEKDPTARYRDMADLEAALCEAQIAAGLTTAWDDLALPELPEWEAERREALLRGMPSPHAIHAPEKRTWLWPAVAGVSTLVAGVAIFLATRPSPPTEQEQSEIDRITLEAREAASRTHWAYPPAGDAEAPTAYRKVLELEGLEGNAEEAGDEQGNTLRGEFSTTLVGLGDRYWEVPGARSFARDYYLQALLFDDRIELARERSGATPGWIAEFRANAAAGQFSDAELASAQLLAALAEEDEAKRQAAFDEALAMEGMNVPASLVNQASQAARATGVKVKRRPPPATDGDPANGGTADSAAAGAAGDAEDAGATNGEDDALVLEEGGESGGEESAGSGSTNGSASGNSGRPKRTKIKHAKRDPATSRELAKQGSEAYRAGRRGEAERLFNQAIAYDSRNAQALMGLSDIYFDTGANQKAVLYAERAVKAAPKNAGYRLKLGDAFYKVLRYRDALSQYKQAKSLGSAKADSRIAKVQAKIG